MGSSAFKTVSPFVCDVISYLLDHGINATINEIIAITSLYVQGYDVNEQTHSPTTAVEAVLGRVAA